MGQRKRNGRMRRAAKRAGKFLAGAVLAAGIMLSPMKARADEKPKEREKIGLNVKMGVAYDYLTAEPRALVSLSAGIPLPLRMRLDAAMGFATKFDGEAKWEELNANLNIPITGPVGIDLYAYNNTHLAVTKLSVGGDVVVGLPFGAAIVAFEHILDGGQRPLIGILKIDAIKNKLAIFTHGGWVTNKDAGVARGRIYYTPKKDYPTIGVDTIFIFNKNELLFVDTLATLDWRF
jgi:hypothetical protein